MGITGSMIAGITTVEAVLQNPTGDVPGGGHVQRSSLRSAAGPRAYVMLCVPKIRFGNIGGEVRPGPAVK